MRLVKDWRQTWRYFSVWAMTVTAAIQGAWAAIPVDMKTAIPDTLINLISIGLLVLGVAGRLVVQVEMKDEDK